MAKIIDFTGYLEEPGYDGTEACNEILDTLKDHYNHVVVLGFTKDHSFEMYNSEMPLMYMSFLHKIMDHEIHMNLTGITEYGQDD